VEVEKEGKKEKRLRVWEVASSHRIKENKKKISRNIAQHRTYI
jgi:hypothetical protein